MTHLLIQSFIQQTFVEYFDVSSTVWITGDINMNNSCIVPALDDLEEVETMVG